MENKKTNISNKWVAYNGAIIGVAAVFIYSLAVMIYTIIRSSITINNIMPNGEKGNILLVTGFSVAYSVAVFSLIMALFSSVAGAVAGVILKNALHYFNPNFIPQKAIAIGCVTALGILGIVYFLLFALLKNRMTFNYIETFSFWFLIPAIIFFGVCVIGGNKLNTVLNTGIA